MKKNNKQKKCTTFRELTKDWMKDIKFKREYEALDLEFKIIRALIENRIKKGLSQKELAEKIGTKQSSIARFESGRYNPSLSFIQKLASALNLKIKVG
jgi:ribosome-binding protein aMBF1 (putative translation factor)